MADADRLSEGALTLLAIARENDPRRQLASNAALEKSLEEVAELPRLCREGGEAALRERLGLAEPPPSFVGLCALVANRLDLEIQREEGRAWSRVSDFDRGAFLALAQTLAEAAGAGRREPGFPNLCRRLGAAEPARLQELLVANYVGNLLQEYFDACKVRIEVPGLPLDTEERLRLDDGRRLARAVFEGIESGPEGAGAAEIQRRLGRVLGELAA